MATKPQIIEELATLGITTTSGTDTIAPLTGQETAPQLAAIFKAAKGQLSGSQDSQPGTKPKLAHVHDATGKRINTYSSEHHADYKERAERVAAKRRGSVVHE